MADKDIAFKLEIDGVEQSIKSVKDLKGAIKALQDEAESADIGSENYKNAIENIEKLNDKLQEITRTEKQAAQAMEDMANAQKEAVKETSDLRKQFEVLEDELFLLAGQGKQNTKEFRDLANEAAKLNKKIDDVNQSLGGSATERAEMGFGKLSESLGKLDFKGVAQGAKMMGTALAATGVMLIVQAVTYLISNFDELSKGSGGLAKALRFVGDVIGDIIAAGEQMLNFVTDFIGVTTEAERNAEEAVKKLADSTYDSINKVSGALDNQTIAYDKQMAILKASGKDVSALEKEKLENIYKTNNAIVQQMSALDLSDEKNKQRLLAAVKAAYDASEQLKVNEAAAQKQRDDNATANAKKYRDANLAMIKQIEDAKIAAIKDEESRAFAKEVLDNERRVRDIKSSEASAKLKNEMLLLNAQQYEDNLAKINSDANAKRKAEEDRIAAEKKAANDKELADKKTLLDQIHAQQIAQDEIDGAAMVEKTEKEKAAGKRKQDEIVQIAEDGLKATQNLSDIYFLFKSQKAEKGSKQEMELAKKQFNVNKALQLGMATIDGFKAITSFLSTNPLTVLGVPNPGAIAGLIALSTTTAATIAKIAASKFEGGGGGAAAGGGGAPTMPSIPEPPTISTASNNTNQSTLFDESGQNLGFKPKQQINVTATVGVDEITSKSNRVSVLEQQSTF